MSDLQNIFLMNAIFLGLGMAALYNAGKLRSSIFVILGMLVGSGIMVMIVGAKYFLLSSIIIGLGCMIYSAAILVFKLNSCTKELKDMTKKRKNETDQGKLQ